MKKNIIGITMGCPAGIGPEIIVTLFSDARRRRYVPVIIGDAAVLRRHMRESGKEFELVPFPGRQRVAERGQEIYFIDRHVLDKKQVTAGVPSRKAGKASLDYIETAVALCKQKEIDAMVTCPINKEAIKKAGSPFPGHTQMIAALTQTKKFGMMLAGSYLRVLLVTTHIALREVPAQLRRKNIYEKIKIGCRSLKEDFGISAPRIAVAGLNPHNGEAGLFGDEESRLIAPAVRTARKKGMAVEGPFPPDTLFARVRNTYDLVICMYHDQGLIPLKLLAFGKGVNITLGLPIVRTSVDHGTAYDIVGRGMANEGSLREAVKQANIIVNNRRKK